MEVLYSDFEIVQTNIITVNTGILVWFIEECICALSLLEIFCGTLGMKIMFSY